MIWVQEYVRVVRVIYILLLLTVDYDISLLVVVIFQILKLLSENFKICNLIIESGESVSPMTKTSKIF
jgi:hypothetical protein